MPDTDSMVGPAHPDPGRIPSFVRHRTRLTEGQQNAWDRWWPVYGGDVAEVSSVGALFLREAPLVLEIGTGNGEATARMAAAEPATNLLGVEVYEPGLAHLLIRLREAEIENLRLLRGDAVDLLERAVPERSLAGIRLYFPDPWPKRRHHKRRLVQPEFAALAASRLVPGGFLHLATDWAHYADQMLAVCDACAALERDEAMDPWLPRPDSRPLTKFEERAVREGRDIRDLLYRSR
ncbi:tRNA (guanosine(46)-N7)-methyltransferase TrmB [Pseudonocardia ailaonensis]|uniref:tRNA (guanine-N(7)-)-methyltransferase n=1 Tax=Pseudonocardia ailaonensis TaxID=367279 RepID=A0ABN2NC80_9PSEU